MKKNLTITAVILVSIISANAQWQLTGNAGTTPGTNFIGTTDLKALVFKTNNQKSGRIDCSGPWNISMGYQSMLSPTGDNNSAFGLYALKALTTGYCNIALGNYSLWKNTSGLFNTGLGYATLSSNTTGHYNVAAGGSALSNNTTGLSNVAVGYGALLKSTTISNQVAIGDSAMYNFNGTSYGWNTAIGSKTLFSNTTGWGNTATGDKVLYSNNGYYNSGYGHLALFSNTTGEQNSAYGVWALSNNAAGNYNTAFGAFGLFVTTGSYNTSVGRSALLNNTTGSYNTAIGEHAGTSVVSFSNTTSVGYNASADGDNKVRIGNTSIVSIGGQVGWTNFSDARVKKEIKQNVPGLAFINLLKPSTYHYDIKKENELLGIKDSTDWKEKFDLEKILFSGFLAQDVDAAAKKIGYDFSGVDKSGSVMGLRYAEFTVPLVKAVQELSQQNDSLKSELESLKSDMEQIKQLLRTNASANTQLLSVNSQLSTSSLSQNAPNPFTKQTVIGYNLPSGFSSAQIIICDNSGKTLQQIQISKPGKGCINVDASALSSGTYYYTLIMDGKKTDSKQMVLAK